MTADKVRENIYYWVSTIQKALDEPEELYPNPHWMDRDKQPYNKKAWILNWLVMSCKYPPKQVVDKLNNPPEWLTDWCNKIYGEEKS